MKDLRKTWVSSDNRLKISDKKIHFYTRTNNPKKQQLKKVIEARQKKTEQN